MPLIVVSLMVNIVVFGLLPIALLGRGVTMLNTYGPDTVARQTLACVYASFAILSFAALLSMPVMSTTAFLIQIATVLLPFQIIFIGLTHWTLGGKNLVFATKLVIAALHTVALLVYWWP